MDDDQEQFSCSLCYFIGTQAEYERHKKCDLHGFNYRLKVFTESRPSIVKNRRGVDIEVTCKDQDVSNLDKFGTNVVTLSESADNTNADIELEYRVRNDRRDSKIILRNVLQLHPNTYFVLSHKYMNNEQMDFAEEPMIEILPKKSYTVKLKFVGPLKISMYRMPIAFMFQMEEACFTLIREMVVNIEKDGSDASELNENKLENVYTGKRWIHGEVIPATIQSDLDREFIVPKEHRKPLLKMLKIYEGELFDQDFYRYQDIKKIFDDGARLNEENYNFFIKLMLWMEELKEDSELRKYNMEAVTVKVATSPMEAAITLSVPGLAEKRPSLVAGDRVHMRMHQDDPKLYYNCEIYEGVITKVLDKEVEIDEFQREFLDIMTNETLIDVRFVMSRLRYERQHRALTFTPDFLERLFPKRQCLSDISSSIDDSDYSEPSTSSSSTSRKSKKISSSNSNKNRIPKREVSSGRKWIRNFTFSNTLVAKNKEQRTAIENIVNNSSGLAPYILFGPPGTGKTITIVEAIVQIIKHIPDSKILVCAPANMACDMLTCKLRDYFHRSELVRVHSPHREFSIIPHEIYDYSNLSFENGEISGTQDMKADELNMRGYKIVVCTLMHAGKYAKQVQQNNASLLFTHLVIDEAAQSMEPETLIPLGGLLCSEKGQLILAGDPRQLGPICQSLQVQQYGLGISLMERLMEFNPLYKSTAGLRDVRYITKLIKNFRSHPDIIKTPNKFFYENELQCCSNEALTDPIVEADILEELPFGGKAIEFYGVSANECRQGRSPSYYNRMEKDVVINYIVKLLLEFGNEKRINPPVKATDIGVISPYIKQVYKIKNDLQMLGGQYNDIEVGSTEAFQGREKRIMIISTVRGKTELLEYDKKYNLGFLVNEKRFNVAITRAKSKLIIVGNPSCLTYNQYWHDYMDECRQLNRYLGYVYMKRNVTLMDFITHNMRKVKIKDAPLQLAA